MKQKWLTLLIKPLQSNIKCKGNGKSFKHKGNDKNKLKQAHHTQEMKHTTHKMKSNTSRPTTAAKYIILAIDWINPTESKLIDGPNLLAQYTWKETTLTHYLINSKYPRNVN